jgi:hypothetical protein
MSVLGTNSVLGSLHRVDMVMLPTFRSHMLQHIHRQYRSNPHSVTVIEHNLQQQETSMKAYNQ